jgi:hypothetical protein
MRPRSISTIFPVSQISIDHHEKGQDAMKRLAMMLGILATAVPMAVAQTST